MTNTTHTRTRRLLAATSPGWWDVPLNDWTVLRSNSVGTSGIDVDSRATDGLTSTRATIPFTVRNGRLVTGPPVLS